MCLYILKNTEELGNMVSYFRNTANTFKSYSNSPSFLGFP